MRLRCSELRLSLSVFRYGVEHSVLHENADCSTYEGGEEVNVDVIACAVETPERLWTNFSCISLAMKIIDYEC